MLNIIRQYDLELFTPDDLNTIKDYQDVLLVDEEGLEILRNYYDVNPTNYYVVNDEASIYRFIIRVFGIKDVKVLQIGLDVGKRLAYAILCDNLLLKAGYVSRPKDLIEVLRKFRDYLMPEKVVVKLGSSSGISSQKLEIFLRDLLLSGFEVIVADESNSSFKTWNTLTGYRMKFTTDIHAALNIAFREGVKVSRL